MNGREYEYPEELLYAKTHEWVREEGEVYVVGISDYAQDMLHDIVFVELPSTGQELVKDEEFMVVESVKSIGEVYAPLSGAIVDVNEELETYPEKINESPYGEGWLVRIEPSDKSEIERLLGVEEYRKTVEGQE